MECSCTTVHMRMTSLCLVLVWCPSKLCLVGGTFHLFGEAGGVSDISGLSQAGAEEMYSVMHKSNTAFTIIH